MPPECSWTTENKPNSASGSRRKRFSAGSERPSSNGIYKRLAFWPLGTILRAGIFPILDANRIQCSPHYMVPNPGEVLDTSTAYQNDGVFLQVVSDARNIGSHFYSVRKSNTRNFTQSRIRLLGCGCVHPRTDASALRAPL
jgi:hypothetical protein